MPTPALPPGFVLDTPHKAAAAAPALPEGFVLDAAPTQASERPWWASNPNDIGGAVYDLSQWGKDDPNYKPSSVPFLDPINAFGSKVAESVPVVGPALAKFGNDVDARFASAVEGREVTPQERAGITSAEQGRFPLASIGGTITGTVLPFALAGGTALGSKALGLTGPLWQRVVAGVGSGGAIAGADALAHGESRGDAAWKAMFGAATGGLFPVAEKGARAVVQALFKRNVDRAAGVLNKGMERDRINPSQIMERLQAAGPDAAILDLGPNLTRQAAAVASLPGEGQAIVRDALVKRNAGKNARIQGDVDTILGPAPVPSQVEATIKEGQEILGPEYLEVFRKAGSVKVDTLPLALELEKKAAVLKGPELQAVTKVRSMLEMNNKPGTLDTNPSVLFQTRQALDGMIGTETNGKVIGQLSQARQQIDNMLAKAVPGIKEVDAKYAELGRQNTAVTRGQSYLDSGKTAPRPAEVASEMQAGALPEGLLVGPSGTAFRLSQGARADIDRIVGTTANNLSALKGALKGDGSWNRQRLVEVFGEKKTDALLDVLDREMRYQRGHDKVLENSESAARLMAQKDVAPHEFQKPTFSDLVFAIPQKVANAGAKTRSEAVNAELAGMLSGKATPEMVDRLLVAKALANRRGLVAPAAMPMITVNYGN